ncbi:MAG: hypothetical protein FD169_1448 [Bacillota bacterium]|nr:MAG: hypothetical protein FD169_1448 [Bacillota bacterium]
MFKLPNFYLLCVVQLSEWKYRLILPVPLFLVDELLAIVPMLTWIARLTPSSAVLEKVDADKICRMVFVVWRKIRVAGSFTMVEVNDNDGTKVKIQLL